MKLRSAAAVLVATVVATTLAAAPAHADIQPKPGSAQVNHDVPFHYARGDHLKRVGDEYPTKSRYGYGRPIYLVGDSMAGQLSDALLRVAKRQGRALLPRSKSAAPFSVPYSQDTEVGRWSLRVFRQIVAEKERHPIVVVAGQYDSADVLRSTIWQLRSKANASVLVVTPSPMPSFTYSNCVARAVRDGKKPNRVCRWHVADEGSGWWQSVTAAQEAGVPYLNLLPHVARGNGSTHPPVVKRALVHRNGSHVTATFCYRMLFAPLRAAVRRAD